MYNTRMSFKDRMTGQKTVWIIKRKEITQKVGITDRENDETQAARW